MSRTNTFDNVSFKKSLTWVMKPFINVTRLYPNKISFCWSVCLDCSLQHLFSWFVSVLPWYLDCPIRLVKISFNAAHDAWFSCHLTKRQIVVCHLSWTRKVWSTALAHPKLQRCHTIRSTNCFEPFLDLWWNELFSCFIKSIFMFHML